MNEAPLLSPGSQDLFRFLHIFSAKLNNAANCYRLPGNRKCATAGQSTAEWNNWKILEINKWSGDLHQK